MGELPCRHGSYDYANVRRWVLPRNLHRAGSECDCILDNDFIVYPVHINNTSWILVVLDLQKHTAFCVDPLEEPGVSSPPCGLSHTQSLLGYLDHQENIQIVHS